MFSRFFGGQPAAEPQPGAARTLRLLEALLRQPSPPRRHRLAAWALRRNRFRIALMVAHAPDGQGGLRVRKLAGNGRDLPLVLEALASRFSPLMGLDRQAPRWLSLQDDPFRHGAAFLRKFDFTAALVLPLGDESEGATPPEAVACLIAADEPLAYDAVSIQEILAIWSLYRTVTAPGWAAHAADPAGAARRAWPLDLAWLTAPAALGIVDRDGVAVVNAAAEQLLADSVGADVDSWRTWLAAAVRRLEEGGLDRDKIVASRSRGVTLEVAIGSRLSGAAGRPGRIVCVRDATDEVLAETRSAETISTISHELRTPLASMKNSVGLLLRGEAGTLAPEAQHFLGMTMRNIDRLNRLIGDLLDVSRAAAGRLDLHRQLVDLVPLVKEALEIFAATARQRRISLNCECGIERLPAHVDGDKVVQMLHNTVGNALKYTPEGGRVRVWLNARPGGSVPAAARLVAERFFLPLRAFALVVEDNGVGMSEEVRRALFQPFARGRQADDPGTPGSGLGLHITRSLVEAHGGTISLESNPGFGTTVWIVLPLDPDSERVLVATRRLSRVLEAAGQARVAFLDARRPGRAPDPAELRRAARVVRDFVARLAQGETATRPLSASGADEPVLGPAAALAAGDLVEEPAPGLWGAVAPRWHRLESAWEVEKARPGAPALLEGTRWEILTLADTPAGEGATSEAEPALRRGEGCPPDRRQSDA